ncbi:MAG: hypothetical protein U9Q77_00540 [Candidatus Marinimicrobia bacterium]|nr:hypothetical protein [Candidatus Neomarinimicrobiota bacterium]
MNRQTHALELSAYEKTLIPDSTSVNVLTLRHSDQIPFKWVEDGQSSVASHGYASEISYDHIFSHGRSMKILLLQQKERFAVSDSSISTLFSSYAKRMLRLSMAHSFLNHHFEAGCGFADGIGLDYLKLNYSHDWNKYSLRIGLTSERHSWQFKVAEGMEHIPVRVDQILTQVGLGVSIYPAWGKLLIDVSHNVPHSLSLEHSNTLWMLLDPYRSGIDIQYTLPLGQLGDLSMFYSNRIDTCNSKIMDESTIIGKIYAFDNREEQVGFELNIGIIDPGLSFHRYRGELRGQVLAGHFGGLLTQLSGARYFQQLQAEMEVLKLFFDAHSSIGKLFELRIKNSLLQGRGKLYSRHHVFQLFNPLTDLSIQEYDIKRMILNEVEAWFQMGIAPKILISVTGGYLIPLKLEIETHPVTKINTAELKLGARMGFQIQYIFD